MSADLLTDQELALIAAEVAEAKRCHVAPSRGDFDVIAERVLYTRVPSLLAHIAALRADRDASNEQLFQCYLAAGCDSDGATRFSDMGLRWPDIGTLAIQGIRDLRRDYEETYEEDSERLKRAEADRDAARELAEGWRLSGLQETTMRIRAEVDRDTLLDELEVWVGVVDLAPEALEVLKRVRPPAGRLDNAPASRPRGVGGGDRA